MRQVILALGVRRRSISKKAFRHPNIPTFDCHLLDGIGIALSARAKALKYHSSKFECTRGADNHGLERLNVETESYTSGLIRLSIWEDGAIWLGIQKSSTVREGGWEIAVRAVGNVTAMDPSSVVNSYESTVGSLPSTIDELISIWARADLKEDE